MLIKCPECDLQVSDKAVFCPHCGYPMKPEKVVKKISKKRMRLPNGFGQISEIKDKNLRKPFRAMVTTGKTDEGKPICKLLQPEAYFETYNEAYQALIDYHKNPYDISKEISMEELYDRWLNTYSKDTDYGTMKNLKGAWNYCNPIKNIMVRDLRIRHMKQCFEEGTFLINGEERHTTPVIRRRIKTLLRKLYDYAIEYDIVDRNYAKDLILPKKDNQLEEDERTPHIPYTEEELQILWENINNYPLAEIVIFQCYTGWRPRELENLKTENINLKEGIMTGGMKTESGKNRIVPIHSRIIPIVEKWYKSAIEQHRNNFISMPTIMGRKADKITYIRYVENLPVLLNALNINPQHRPHDGRVTFVTLAKKYQMDEYAIKHIVGHKISDITESIYTKRDNSWLKSEIEKIV